MATPEVVAVLHRFCEEGPLGGGDCEKETQTRGSVCGKERQEVEKEEEVGGFEQQEVECEGECEETTMICISPPACRHQDRRLARSNCNNHHDRKFARPRG